ncbi:MAG: sugar kinase [Anaerolineae bacterium]
MTYDVVTFGETMLRLAPAGGLRLEQAAQLEMAFGGAESNVATNLARLGKRVAWFSRLPDNPLGQQCAAAIRKQGVDVSAVEWAAGERMGLYFVEYGQKPRAVKVWYDRAGSAASRMSAAGLPLPVIGAARWLHLTGITPALSAGCAEAVQAAAAYARTQGVSVSFDVNYRGLLWDAKTAAKALVPLCEQANVVFVALRDAHNLFAAEGDAERAARDLQARWQGTVIVTCGEEGAAACDGVQTVKVPAYATTLVDRIGAGDAFASGVICRLLEDAPLVEALRFGAALAALKLTIIGDAALVSRAEVEAVMSQGQKALER